MNPSSPKRGFTLIELLVVIAIITILMGLLFPVVNSVKEQARKVQAKNDLTQIVNAVKAYYTEYGKYPNDVPAITGSNDIPAYVGSANSALIDVLRNNTASTATAAAGGNLVSTLNPRQIVFLEAPTVKDENSPKSGVTTTKAPIGVWYDPWGTAYNFAIDSNYDNQILKATHLYTDPSFAIINTGAIGWSYGKDKKQGTNGGNAYANSDDVISWQ